MKCQWRRRNNSLIKTLRIMVSAPRSPNRALHPIIVIIVFLFNDYCVIFASKFTTHSSRINITLKIYVYQHYTRIHYYILYTIRVLCNKISSSAEIIVELAFTPDFAIRDGQVVLSRARIIIIIILCTMAINAKTATTTPFSVTGLWVGGEV